MAEEDDAVPVVKGDGDVELELLAAEAVEEGLLEASVDEIEVLLGQHLRTTVLSDSVGGTDVPEWASGDYGPSNLARRFLDYQSDAIRRQICLSDGSGLKPKYARLLRADTSKAGALTGVAGAMMAVLNIEPGTVIGPATALYVALWLGHANLEMWCISGGSIRNPGAGNGV